MRGYLRMAGLLLVFLALLTAAGCDNDNDDWGQVGTVYLMDVGADCWVIRVEDSSVDHGYVQYEPDNLSDEFRVNGLWVRFDHVFPDEWVSHCMIGEGIIITRIEAL